MDRPRAAIDKGVGRKRSREGRTAREYFIVNPRGIIHEVTRDHAAKRLKSPGWRVPTPEELEIYRSRRDEANVARVKAMDAVYERGLDPKSGLGNEIVSKQAPHFIQRPTDPIALPWGMDNREAVEDWIDEQLGQFEGDGDE